jgi:septal ring factor EnvC (AmiA/AmiB activator)
MTNEPPKRIGLVSDGLGLWALAHVKEAEHSVHYVRADIADIWKADAKAHEKELAVWAENYAALERERADIADIWKAEVDRLRELLLTWQAAYKTGRNEPLAVAYDVTRVCLAAPGVEP